MALLLIPSSFRCDCGHESHFFENTIKEMLKMSKKKRNLLADGGKNEHTIVFAYGEAIEILNLRNDGVVLVINIKNRCTKELTNFEVFIQGKPANIILASSFLPGTNGKLIVNGNVQGGDAVLVKSGALFDEKVFADDDVSSAATVSLGYN